MKRLFITIILVLSLLCFSPINTKALELPKVLEITTNSTYILDVNNTTTNTETEVQECSGKDSIFGDPSDPNSVAWLIQEILNYIKILGPILVIVLSSVDFIKVIVKSDDKEMAAAQRKLIIRLILALLLFLIPTIVNAILNIFGYSTDPTCGLK